MWKDSIKNIVVIFQLDYFQPNILKIVGFYVRHSAFVMYLRCCQIFESSTFQPNIIIKFYSKILLNLDFYLLRSLTFDKISQKIMWLKQFGIKKSGIIG